MDQPAKRQGTARPRQEAEPVDEQLPAHWKQRPREEVVAELLQRFENGQNLREICRLEHMPSRTLLHRWMEEDKSLNERIARARLLWRAALEDECVEIADAATPANADLAKLRIWTRMQLLDRADAVIKSQPTENNAYVPPEVRFIGVEPYRPAIEGEARRVEVEDDV